MEFGSIDGLSDEKDELMGGDEESLGLRESSSDECD